MSHLDDYTSKVQVLEAIPENDVKTPGSIPLDTYIHEARMVHDYGQEDLEALSARGLSPELVADIPIRIGALKYAEDLWNAHRYTPGESGIRWANGSHEAYELRNSMIQEFRYAFDDNDNLLKRVDAIANKGGHPDMLGDLSKLSVLGKENADLLAATNFDMTLLDQAEEMSKTFGELYAETVIERKDSNGYKAMRDRAYTHLKEAVDKVRKCGKFVFRADPKHMERYTSDYLRKMNNRRSDDPNTPEPVISEEIPDQEPIPEETPMVDQQAA